MTGRTPPSRHLRRGRCRPPSTGLRGVSTDQLATTHRVRTVDECARAAGQDVQAGDRRPAVRRETRVVILLGEILGDEKCQDLFLRAADDPAQVVDMSFDVTAGAERPERYMLVGYDEL
jgi:hypothetical protein